MAVVGFDFGNLNCYIAVARQGGIDVITNDYSLHATPACVAFGSRDRVCGIAARQKVNTNFKSTVLNFKQLLGLKFSDPEAKKMKKYIPCEMVQLDNDNIGLKVNYLDKEQILTPEQVTAALFVKLKSITELSCEEIKCVSDLVVTVPPYFTDVQRRALKAAVDLTGMNCLRLVNENSAAASAYGIYKQDLPPEGSPPKVVVIVDGGHTSVQATLCLFNKGKCEIVGYTYDTDVGGLYFDSSIREHFRKMFVEKYKINAETNPRAWLRLLDECEKIKKQMSTNSIALPLNIECFMNDVDVTGKMCREEFENVAAPLFERVRSLLQRLLQETGYTPDKINEVEIIGGSSRIPSFKKIIKDVFGMEPKTTMNQDDSISRGAALQCAILSPAVRVRDFALYEKLGHQIVIKYGDSNDLKALWKGNAEVGSTKLITTLRRGDFIVDGLYNSPYEVQPQNFIGRWVVKGVTPNADGSDKKVKIKAGVNNSGIFEVFGATAYEVVPLCKEEIEAEANEAAKNPPSEETKEGEENASEKQQPAAPKTKTISTELVVEAQIPYIFDIYKARDFELKMQQTDLLEKQKADAKNAVEEYVYDMRDKLCEVLADFIQESEADEFKAHLQKTEDWLYEDGEDAETKVYEEKLSFLKKIGDPVVERYHEYENRAILFEAIETKIMQIDKFIDQYNNGVEAYSHIDKNDVKKVQDAVEEKRKWVWENKDKQAKKAKYDAPHVWCREISNAKALLDSIVNPIMNRPKPKVEPPKKEKKEPAQPAEESQDINGETKQPQEMEID
ncbi:Heat shock protein 4 [Strongyloides ratti]|uniref:Heat shock protein 4 n=1 Tax=Strongyloides ratti TaxID=34506 RepID=A0A090LIM0_STRRB|nr:Heat shock protein 4 [Strongyloides ratti]CEF67335.1 Heat shock protein 4 [Strongyloides ratti]